MTRPLNDQGVSVIVGTLLLILIVVTAAAALALMVSQLQKNEMTQQSHLAAVKAENVQFASVNFQNDLVAWNQTPYNITTSGNWSSVTLHLVNLNTDDVNIVAVAVSGSSSGNAQYARNITVINAAINGLPQQQLYNQSSSGTFNLDIPGTQSREIQINFINGFPSSPLYIGTHDQVRIMIMTSLNNFFEQTFKPPNPIVQSSIATESLGVLQRDVLVLDGSQSTSDNTISTWNWTIVNAANAYPLGSGNCGDSLNLTDSITLQGKIIRYNPAVPGPFCVNLTATDNVGMMATSNYISIPADAQFSPPANIVATYNNPPFVNVTIKDTNGNSVQGAVVNYIAEQSQQYGNLTLSDYVGTTDINGMNSSNVTCGIGTVKVVSGQLSPIEVAVKAPNTGC